MAPQWGMSLAQKYGAQLLLLHVIPSVVEEVSIQRPGASLYWLSLVDHPDFYAALGQGGQVIAVPAGRGNGATAGTTSSGAFATRAARWYAPCSLTRGGRRQHHLGLGRPAPGWHLA